MRKILRNLPAALAALILACPASHATVIQVQGVMESVVTVYMTRSLNAKKGSRNLAYRVFLPSDVMEPSRTQEITGARRNVVPNPSTSNEFADEFGNKVLDLAWNREVGKIHIEMEFTAKVRALFNSLNSESPFPPFLGEKDRTFLVSTPLSPANDLFINYLGRTISQNLHREIDVVNSAFLWLDGNIRLSGAGENAPSPSAISVLKARTGDARGISNLLAALLKGMGIPARVAYGVSVQTELEIKNDGARYAFDQPTGERFWVEVFFPDLGWVAYDPHGYHFASSSRVIKLAAGSDSETASERWKLETGEVKVVKEYICDVRSDSASLTPAGTLGHDVKRIVLSPALPEINLYTAEPNLDIEGLRGEAPPPELAPGASGVILGNDDLDGKLEIAATKNRVYAQRVAIGFPAGLAEIKLPLVKVSDSGKIWVEVYADNGGIPGEKLLKSGSIDSPRIRFMMMNNPWVSFPFPAGSRLAAGAFWFALRSSGSCAFNWYAIEGNVTGTDSDTRYLDAGQKKTDWGNILNYDMGFQIVGENLTGRQ